MLKEIKRPTNQVNFWIKKLKVNQYGILKALLLRYNFYVQIYIP